MILEKKWQKHIKVYNKLNDDGEKKYNKIRKHGSLDKQVAGLAC